MQPVPALEIIGYGDKKALLVSLRNLALSTRGRIDPVSEMGKRMTQVFEGHSYLKHVLVDFTDLENFESSLLGKLITLRKKTVQEREGKIVLFGMDRHTREIFETTKLETLFRFAKTQEEAMNML